MNGRFAPSPTGALHLGNLRTALAAWLCARSSGGRFMVRMEDLDTLVSRREFADGQLRDLEAIGLNWDGEVVFQSERLDLYRHAVQQLVSAELTYPCFCTRREIREAASAPNGAAQPDGAYPGTCRHLDGHARRQLETSGRRPALRLRADSGSSLGFTDARCGLVQAAIDDVVLVRNDGVFAYNLAVVVDDAAQGVEQVVRGDDLLLSTPRQIYLARLLGLSVPTYAHLPLVLGPDGERLAKRHGAVSLSELVVSGWTPRAVRDLLLARLGCRHASNDLCDVALTFAVGDIPNTPWRISDAEVDAFGVAPR